MSKYLTPPIPNAILILMTYEPFISYDQLHMMVLAFLATCIAIPVGSFIYSWIISLTHLESQKIVVPSYDFGPERDPIHIMGQHTPYDWAQEIN